MHLTPHFIYKEYGRFDFCGCLFPYKIRVLLFHGWSGGLSERYIFVKQMSMSFRYTQTGSSLSSSTSASTAPSFIYAALHPRALEYNPLLFLLCPRFSTMSMFYFLSASDTWTYFLFCGTMPVYILCEILIWKAIRSFQICHTICRKGKQYETRCSISLHYYMD